MSSSLSSSLLLLSLHGSPPPGADPSNSPLPTTPSRHRPSHPLLSPSSSLTLLLLRLLCFFCGFFSVASVVAPLPASAMDLSPSTVPDPPSSSSAISSLLSLKASWIDPLNSLASWDPSASTWYCRKWRGVACGADNSTVMYLNLAYFSLSGPLPPSIANFPFLHTLNLAHNNLAGNIPVELGSLSFLKVLHLRHNFFNGSIPENLFRASSLQFLLLEGNALTGNISSSISNLVNLKYLSFGSNAVSGSLPASITTLSKLAALYGGPNKLTGGIPERIGDLRRLTQFDLQGNLLTGDIPSSIGSCTALERLDLSDNQLTGRLPAVELGGLRNMKFMDLSSNHFSGSIPAELGKLSALQTLDLHQNNLSGMISPSLGNLAALKSLNLSHNNLSGEVPTNGVLANFSEACFAGNTFLCGGPLMYVRCVSPPPPTLAPAPSLVGLPPLNASSKSSETWKIVTGVVVGAFASLLLILFVPFMLWKRRPMETQIQNRLSPDLSENVSTSKLEMYARGYEYSYDEIVSHAGYYDTAHVVGKGRFAIVYRTDLPGGRQLAVKVFKNPIPQAAFEREVEGLESASHFCSLLTIKGYFASDTEKAIFYDFMRKGSLYDVLHNNPDAPAQLDWSKRLNIATGVAQAVAHLHKGSSLRVLHKDLKSTNVFLDEAMYPLVADYGLIGLVSKSLVETPGYMPPELKANKKYTEKTDVYSFGVVLLELLTGKKPVSYIGDRQLNLVTWAIRLQRDGRGREVFSANLVESCPYPDYPERTLNLAILCLSDQPAQRPTMAECASILEGLGGNNSPIRSPGIQQDRPLLM